MSTWGTEKVVKGGKVWEVLALTPGPTGMRTAHPWKPAPGLLSGEGSFEKNPQPRLSLPLPSHPGMTVLIAIYVLLTANKIIIINPTLLSDSKRHLL